MVKRGILFVASVALIALSGCATHSQSYGVAQSTESDVRPSALPSDLVGTWHVAHAPVGSDASGGNALVARPSSSRTTARTQRSTDERDRREPSRASS